jgi:hypothetical protein
MENAVSRIKVLSLDTGFGRPYGVDPYRNNCHMTTNLLVTCNSIEGTPATTLFQSTVCALLDRKSILTLRWKTFTVSTFDVHDS